MQRIIEIIEYLFQFQKEFFYSLFQFGIAVVVFVILYFFREKFSGFKTSKIINLKTKQWKLLSLLILLVAVFSGLLFAIKMPVLGDEAVHVLSSYGVIEGLIPYKDFVLTNPPLNLYAYGIFFKITSFSILAARILSFLFFLLSLYFIYKIFVFYFEEAYIPLAIFLFLVILHPSDFSQFFYIGTKESFAFFVILLSFFFLKNNTQKSLFLSGVFAALAFFTKLTFLVLLPVGFLAILITNYKKERLFKKEISFFLGFFTIMIPTLIFFFPYRQQVLHNLVIGLWPQVYQRQIVLDPIISSRLELTGLSIVGWVLRHYIIFFVWIFLLVRFFIEFKKREMISNIPIIIIWSIIFIITFGISSLLFLPTALNRFLIIMNMFLCFSIAFLIIYFLKKSQLIVEIKKMSLIFIFLILIFAVTNPKQLTTYTLLDNSVINQYQEGTKLGDAIKSVPGFEQKQIVFLGAFSNLLAQGSIPAKKLHPTAYMSIKFWDVPLHKSLSLEDANYYHYMTEKVLKDITEKRDNFIIVLEIPNQFESELKNLVEKAYLYQKTIGVGNKLYKIYYQ